MPFPADVQYFLQDLVLAERGSEERLHAARQKSGRIINLVGRDNLQSEADRLSHHISVENVLARVLAGA